NYEYLAEKHNNIEQCILPAWLVEPRSRANPEHFPRPAGVRLDTSDRGVDIVASPKVNRIIIKLTLDWLPLFIFLELIWLKGHDPGLASTSCPMRLAPKFSGFFQHSIVQFDAFRWGVWKMLHDYGLLLLTHPCTIIDVHRCTLLGVLIADISHAKINLDERSGRGECFGGES